MKVLIAALQYSLSQNISENQKKVISFIEKAAQQKAKIIVLPELYNSQYFCQEEKISHFDLAEPLQGPSFNLFSQLAKTLKVSLLIPFFEKRAIGVYHNSVMGIDSDGQLLGHYRKMHIPDDPLFYEKFYFTPGDLGYKVFHTEEMNISPLICWDQWYPEASRISSLMGANCLYYPTAIGWHPKEKEIYGKAQIDSWMTIQKSHAIANGVFVISANRVGLEKIDEKSDGIEFWGSSFICDPQGQILVQASNNKEEIIYAEIDLDKQETIRRNWPFLRDRRIDSYSPILNRLIDQ
jgi:N-carbamoylputrescine amidase